MATCPLAFVELILLLRAYALWRPNKPVLVIMIFIWVSVIGCCFLFAALGAAKMPPIPGGVPCVPAVSEEKYMVAYFSLRECPQILCNCVRST